MTFIKYTNDGKAVIQPAALTLSGLEQEETLEMHTLENAIVLLKQEMEPVEKGAAMMALMRLAQQPDGGYAGRLGGPGGRWGYVRRLPRLR